MLIQTRVADTNLVGQLLELFERHLLEVAVVQNYIGPRSYPSACA